jgi:hypothetical protein
LGLNNYINQYFPTLISTFDVNEIQMGEEYSIIISKDGKFYSTGANKVKYLYFLKQNGQLGIGSSLYSFNNFQQIINVNLFSEIFSTRTYSLLSFKNISCSGTSQYDSRVCSGYGNCLNNKCECFFGHYGNNCEFTSCFDTISNSPNICSGKGICIKLNTCQCNGLFYGNKCEFYNCFDKIYNDTNVCSSRGKCISPNKCK